MNSSRKTLIVRLSSFGDILQCLCVPQRIKDQDPQGEVHWVVRADFAELLQPHPHIDKVWSFDRRQGLLAWLKICLELRRQGFTHLYDAHNNPRSRILRLFFVGRSLQFRRRSKFRWKRFLLFRLRRNLFPQPFRGQISFLEPLAPWGIQPEVSRSSQLHFSAAVRQKVASVLHGFQPFAALAPSAAWEMKRWPPDHWKDLIRQSSRRFVILGGPADEFCRELQDIAPERVMNCAGKFSLLESCAVLDLAEAVVSADTGLLHAADLLGKKTVALIGPTAFGYPSHPNAVVLQTELACRPCSKDGRGKCSQAVYRKCMVDIRPDSVREVMERQDHV